MNGERLEFKGSVLRGYTKWLRENGYFERVLAQGDAIAKARLMDPPMVTEWVPHEQQFAVLRAVHAVGGDALIRVMIHGSMQSGVLKLLEPLIQGAARVFGRTPATILSRLNSIRKNLVRGVDFRYRAQGDRAAVVEALSERDPLSAHSALAWAASLEAVALSLGFDTTKATFETSADNMCATITVRW